MWNLNPLAACLLVIAVWLPLCAEEKTQSIYLAPDGNDAWSGLIDASNAEKSDGPLATLNRARELVRKLRGDQKAPRPIDIVLRGGRYELAEPLVFSPADSGTAKSPITYRAYPNEKPIISGGRKITNWKPGANGQFVAEINEAKSGAWPFTQLFVNGERRFRPRLPKTGYYTIAGFAGADPKAKYNTPANAFNFKEGEIKSSWTNPNDIETVVLHFWVDTHFQISKIDDATKTVTFDRHSLRKLTDDHSSNGARYYLRNVFEALESPGEFYLNSQSGQLHYLPKPGEDLQKAEVIAPRLDSLIRFQGDPAKGMFVEHINLEGLTFSDTEWQLPKKSAGDLQAADGVPGVIHAQGMRRCAIRDCIIKNCATYGMEILAGCVENVIERNEFANLGAGGIKISGGGSGSPENEHTGRTKITDNHIHHCGEIYHAAVGILCRHSAGNTIAHNHIHHLYYTAISIGWVWGYKPSISRDNIIEFNHIHDIGQKVLSDMGGIYMLGISPGTIVRNNLLHDIDSWGYGGWGIYTDEGSSEILIENNVVYRTKSGGFHQHYGRDNIVRNNIFALAREEQIARSRAEPHLSFTFERNIVYYKEGPLLGKNWKDDKFKIDGNLYFHAGGKEVTFPSGNFESWQKRGFDKASLIADPLFAAPETGDFSLKAESPAFKLGLKPIDISKVGPRPRAGN